MYNIELCMYNVQHFITFEYENDVETMVIENKLFSRSFKINLLSEKGLCVTLQYYYVYCLFKIITYTTIVLLFHSFINPTVFYNIPSRIRKIY